MSIEFFISDAGTILREYLTQNITGEILGTLVGGVDTSDLPSIMIAFPATEILPKGVHTILIDSELILVSTANGVTFNVEPGGRAYFGTLRTTHNVNSIVKRASLFDIMGTEIYNGALPEDWENETPVILCNIQPGFKSEFTPRQSPRCQFKVYGGSDEEKIMQEDAPKLIYRLLVERLETANHEILNNGTLGAVKMETGQDLIDTDIEPSWPFILTFGQLTII